MAKLETMAAATPVEAMLEVLHRDGALIVADATDAGVLDALDDELAPYLESRRTGTNEFGGYETKRIGALMARSPTSRRLALDPQINALCSRYLAPFCDGYQLHFTQAVSIGPGESAQALHRDRGVWGGYVSRQTETQFSTIWALTEFNARNGATRVVPGSHLWDADRAPLEEEIASAEMSKGSVLIYNGTVLHGGGANETGERRVGILLHYTLSWLRQEENQYLSCPPPIAATLEPELRALMGYSKGGFVLGFYSDPTSVEGGPELASPEALFGDGPSGFDDDALSADELLERTS